MVRPTIDRSGRQLRTRRLLILPALAAVTLMAVLAVVAGGPPWGSGGAPAQAAIIEDASFAPVGAGPASHLPGTGSPLVSFQGRLTDPGTGLPISDGSYSTTFRIYDAAAGGNALWTETQSVAVTDGLFSVLLGSVTPLATGLFTETPRYLSVQVSSDPEMTPRIQFANVPYAFAAEQAGALSRLGFSLTAVDSAGSVGEWASIAVGFDGLPVVSYTDNTNTALKVAHCGNAACSAGNTITTVDSAGGVGSASSITIGADGLPVVAYYDPANGDLKVAKCGNAACTAGNTITTVDSAGNVGGDPSITTSRKGLPNISYYDGTNGDLKFASCATADCSVATINTVDSAGDVGRYSSVVISASDYYNHATISYYDATNGDLKIAHCGNLSCSGSLATTVDSVGTVGVRTSIAMGADGLAIVSYHDFTNDRLKVAHCGSADCSAANTVTTVDSGALGNVGDYSSIAIGPDGLPVISYYDSTNGDLKLAHCRDTSCSVTATLTTVDDPDVEATVAGRMTSVTIGSDGLPVIAYRDDTNGDLKVAHCSNRFCTPYTRPR